MTLWLVLVLVLMTLAAVSAVLWPLWRSDRALRSGSDLVVYRDQIEEIQRDRSAGLIGESEAEAAQVEVSRRLLAAADADAAAPQPSPTAVLTRRRRAVAIAALVMLPLGASAVYLALGLATPAGTTGGGAPGQRVDRDHGRTGRRSSCQESGRRSWLGIDRAGLSQLGRFEDAIKARRNAIALNGESAERYAGLGEALAAADGGMITPEAKTAFERAVKLDGENVRARYYLGLAAEQAGTPAEAASIWRAMIARAPADAPWADFIRGEIARLDGGPGEEEVAAAGGTQSRTAHRHGPRHGGTARRAAAARRLPTWRDGCGSCAPIWCWAETAKARAAAGDARRALAERSGEVAPVSEEFVKGLGIEG